MASTTSGTVSFSMDVDDIIEQAIDAIGKEHMSGIEAGKARRVLNLILIQLQNKNVPLNKIDTVSVSLTDGTASYLLDASIIDILEATILKDTNELSISRKGLREFHKFPKKDQEAARPNMFVTERLNDQERITFWPVPNNDDCVAKLLVFKKIEDITASYQKIDLPVRYLPLLVKWLAYELALNRAGIPDNLKATLKMEYKELLPDTFDEDRERTDIFIKPGGISGR